MKLKFIISLVLAVSFFAFFGIALAKTLDKASQGIGEDKKKASTLNKEVDAVGDGENEVTPTVDELNTDEGTLMPTVVVKNISFAQCMTAENCCEKNDCNFKCSPTSEGGITDRKYQGSCDCERTPSGEEINIDEYSLGFKEGQVTACLTAAGFPADSIDVY